jgi:hypothetical protein
MGCGCNKNKRRSSVRTVGPAASARAVNRPSDIQAQATLNEIQTRTTGMTKEQRDEERKKRIQAIINKKKFQ